MHPCLARDGVRDIQTGTGQGTLGSALGCAAPPAEGSRAGRCFEGCCRRWWCSLPPVRCGAVGAAGWRTGRSCSQALPVVRRGLRGGQAPPRPGRSGPGRDAAPAALAAGCRGQQRPAHRREGPRCHRGLCGEGSACARACGTQRQPRRLRAHRARAAGPCLHSEPWHTQTQGRASAHTPAPARTPVCHAPRAAGPGPECLCCPASLGPGLSSHRTVPVLLP